MFRKFIVKLFLRYFNLNFGEKDPLVVEFLRFFDKIFAHKTIILDKNIKNEKIKISIGDDATKLLKYFNISINL